MVEIARLGLLSRAVTIRRDRNEMALAEASRVREGRERALTTAQAAETRAAAGARDADRSFAADPGSAQAQIWRRVQFERAAEARATVETRAGDHDAAIARQEQALNELRRADVRADRTRDLHARAVLAYAVRRDDREAEDRPAKVDRIV